MAVPPADRVLRRIGQAVEPNHRFFMLVALSGTRKNTALRDVHARARVPLLNVQLDLSHRRLGLTELQQVPQLPSLPPELMNVARAAERRITWQG